MSKRFHDFLLPYAPNNVSTHALYAPGCYLLPFWVWLHDLLCSKLNDFLETQNKDIGSTILSVASLHATRFITLRSLFKGNAVKLQLKAIF